MNNHRRSILKAAGVSAGGALLPVLLSQKSHAQSNGASLATGRVPSNPRINEWALVKNEEYSNRAWTEEFQGMCTDGTYWYVVSNASDKQRLYKLSYDFSTQYGYVGAPSGTGHAGAPTYDPERRLIYVPLEGAYNGVWSVTTDLKTAAQFQLRGRGGVGTSPQFQKNPWLAYNSHDKLIYSSVFGDPEEASNINRVRYIYGYSRFTGALQKVVALPSNVHRIQGGTFCNLGKNLYLISDYEESGNELKHLYAYDFSNAVDGATVSTWGKMAIPTSDEIESVTWAHRRWKDGHQTWITVGILDNDWPSKDDVMLRNFGVPDPAAL